MEGKTVKCSEIFQLLHKYKLLPISNSLRTYFKVHSIKRKKHAFFLTRPLQILTIRISKEKTICIELFRLPGVPKRRESWRNENVGMFVVLSSRKWESLLVP